MNLLKINCIYLDSEFSSVAERSAVKFVVTEMSRVQSTQLRFFLYFNNKFKKKNINNN